MSTGPSPVLKYSKNHSTGADKTYATMSDKDSPQGFKQNRIKCGRSCKFACKENTYTHISNL